jgi:VanZ family protein
LSQRELEPSDLNSVDSSQQLKAPPEFPFAGILLGIVLLAGVLLLSPLPIHGRIVKPLCDLVHLPMFIILTYVSLVWRESKRSWKKQVPLWLVPLTLLVAGNAFELAQKFFNRGTSLEDAISNTFGIAIGCLLFWANYRCSGNLKTILRIIALIFFVSIWSTTLWTLLPFLRSQQ